MEVQYISLPTKDGYNSASKELPVFQVPREDDFQAWKKARQLEREAEAQAYKEAVRSSSVQSYRGESVRPTRTTVDPVRKRRAGAEQKTSLPAGDNYHLTKKLPVFSNAEPNLRLDPRVGFALSSR